MKKTICLLLSIFIISAFTACGDNNALQEEIPYPEVLEESEELENEEPAEPDSGEWISEGFFVIGTTLYDAKGEPFVMRGVNYPHTWFKDQLDTALPAIAQTGSNTVRVVLANGEQWRRDSVEDVLRIIELCKELEMIAVLEVHDATGRNDVDDLMKAVEYWIEIKDILIGNEAYVIVNIANEWFGRWDSAGWRDGYLEAIPALREAGIRNTLMVDAAGWGQYPRSVHEMGREVFEADELGNTIFSIHMYEYAGKDEKTVKDNINRALAVDVPVVIGEFGHRHHDGEVAFLTILSYCEEIGAGYLGWSWKGNSGGVEYLDIALEWDGSVLSADWGEILINSEFGIKRTSKKCTVFA
ncbi:MAG: glycoside hydrolase family 5 protein [Oscillospiraceae bacterium]|nr:glycoside hydrolase family 5 protein [Oscillospiraceae bacterium]